MSSAWTFLDCPISIPRSTPTYSRHEWYSRISTEWRGCIVRNTHVQGERYLPTYVRPICESNGIGRRPAGLFAGRWTWLFCGLGTTAIYITSEDYSPLDTYVVSTAGYPVACINVVQSRSMVIKPTMWMDNG